MGRILIQAVHQAGYQLSAAVERPESSLIGSDAGELAGVGKLNVAVAGRLEDVIDQCDVIIDFTDPDATEQHLQICRDAAVAIVIGTTGLSEVQKQLVDDAAKQIQVVYSGNYSVGVNVSLKLLELAAKTFW